MQGFVRQKTLRNYRELLAQERAETERLFIAAVLAREEKAKTANVHREDGLSDRHLSHS